MDKEAVRRYFDLHASTWDAEMIRSDEIISKILDGARVGPGCDVLDVACGTGVLFPDYLARGIASLTAIDLSPEMVRIAGSKFADPRVCVLCGDAAQQDYDRLFDCVVVYNAFPHFPQPEALIGHLSASLKKGGTLTVAHGMSAQAINRHHEGSAKEVSIGLMDAGTLADLMGRYLHVDIILSDENMYQLTGTRL